MAEDSPVVLHADAPQALQDDVCALAGKAVRSYLRGEGLRTLQEVALALKKDLSGKAEGSWHVVVGSQFGSYVTHEVGTMVFLKVGHVQVLAFKHG